MEMQTFESDHQKRRSVETTNIFLLNDHLNGRHDLGHNDKQVAWK